MKKIYTYIIISFILFPISVFADCVRETWGCSSDKIVQRGDENDSNIVESYKGYQVHVMARQQSGTNVYCIKSGASIPAAGTNLCESNINLVNNTLENNKLRAAIGYIIYWLDPDYPVFDKDDNDVYDDDGVIVEDYLNYMRAQHLIHSILYNAGIGDYKYDDSSSDDYYFETDSWFNEAWDQYLYYGEEDVEILSLDYTEEEDYYIITADIYNPLYTIPDYIVTIDGEEIEYAAMDDSSGTISLELEKDLFASSSELKLEVFYTNYYHMAQFRDCGGTRQPIAESWTEDEWITVSDDETITINNTPIYTVTYDANGGENAPEPQDFEYDSQDPISTQIPTWHGHTFLYWTTIWREEPFDPGDTIPLGWGDFTLYAQWEEDDGILEIYKTKQIGVKDNGEPETEAVNSKTVGFRKYDDFDTCYQDIDNNAEGDYFTIYTGGDGRGSISLRPGGYYIREIDAPDGYGKSNECRYVNITPGDTESIEIINKTQCAFDFEKNSSISNRIKIYLEKHTTSNNLLDFTLEDSFSACDSYVPNYKKSTSCLKSSQNTGFIFSHDDLSGFNDVIQYYNSDVGFCLTEFETQSHVSLPSYPIKNGTFIISTPDPNPVPVITGILTKTCYVYEDITEDFYDKESYEDYIYGITLDGTNNLSYDYDDAYSKLYMEYIETADNGLHKFVGQSSVDYYFEPVYVSKISGKPDCSSASKKCVNIGYGLISEFQEGKYDYDYFDFEVYFNSKTNINNPSEDIFDDDWATCEYEISQEIIKYDNNSNGELDLEFRTIDTTNPFNRTPNSNWNDGSNKNNSDNSIIRDYILNATNSYGKKEGESVKQTPKYKITLTPDVINEIRNHNKSNAYDNYEVCNGSNCESDNYFIDYYIKEGVIQK